MSWPKGRPRPRQPGWRVRQPWDQEQWVAAFLAKVIREQSGCWRWTGTLSGGRKGDPYGYVQKAGRMQPAHRAYWEELHGPVPNGMDLDHLCRNRACVNPEHLEPVTRLENILRGELGARWLLARARGGRA